MATTTDIRKWALEHGLTVGPKGPLPEAVMARYDAEHAGAGLDLEPDQPEDGGSVAAAAPPPPGPGPEPETPRTVERRPARPPKPGPGSWRAFQGWFKGGGARAPGRSKPPGRKPARVSIAGLIEDAWGQMAFASAQLPPMQKLLQAQAPYAGIALEDALAGTFVDRVLQPAARAEDKAKAVGGLLMPPMALMLVLATAPQPSEVQTEQGPALVWPEPSAQHKGALISLRWSLMLWSEAGAARLEEYQARAEANADRGAQADRFMGWILGMPDPGDGQADDGAAAAELGAAAAEDEAVRRAQQMFGGD